MPTQITGDPANRRILSLTDLDLDDDAAAVRRHWTVTYQPANIWTVADQTISAKTQEIFDLAARYRSRTVLRMPRARKHLVCLSNTPYYHISSRCVRQALLCGIDQRTGKSYEHRRGWIEDRLRVLASLFSLELCAYAVMSNHYHLVVKLKPEEAHRWSDDEVLERWTALFRGPLLVQRYRNGHALTPTEADTLRSITAVFRERLASLSWFMKCLNEPIARQANAEDGCTGHFWQARFHSQALCSDQALLTAMAYVDLNPVRAGLARTPEQSEYTSIKARIEADRSRSTGAVSTLTDAVSRLLERGELYHWNTPLRPLMRFSDGVTRTNDTGKPSETLPMRQTEYLTLVDATGRHLARGKQGRIDPALEPILTRLGLSAEHWTQASSAFRRYYRNGDLRLRPSA